MIAPVMVWVVDTGMPKWAAPNSVKAPAASAANSPIGWSLVIRDPMVWTMRQPPEEASRGRGRRGLSKTHWKKRTKVANALKPIAPSSGRSLERQCLRNWQPGLRPVA